MEKLKAIFLACILAGIAGCYCDDCTYSEEELPAYANKSGETVKIISIWGDYTLGWTGTDDRYEKFIDDGDTLHYTSEGWPTEDWRVPLPATVNCGFVLYGDCDKPIRMELHFDDPQKCLIFDGPIKNDGFDMRSWDSYKRGRKIDDWAGYSVGVEYVYTITREHREMAKEEDCLSDSL